MSVPASSAGTVTYDGAPESVSRLRTAWAARDGPARRAGPASRLVNHSVSRMPVILRTTGLLVLSNVFMTFAWYAHLRNLSERPWWVAAFASWGIALFEYLLQVPANRIGYTALDLGQLKIIQEAITLAVFVPFAVIYMRQPLRLDFLWAALCLCGAVYFSGADVSDVTVDGDGRPRAAASEAGRQPDRRRHGAPRAPTPPAAAASVPSPACAAAPSPSRASARRARPRARAAAPSAAAASGLMRCRRSRT